MTMTDILRRYLLLPLAISFAVFIQVAAVELGHPQAVWLYCDMMRLCTP